MLTFTNLHPHRDTIGRSGGVVVVVVVVVVAVMVRVQNVVVGNLGWWRVCLLLHSRRRLFLLMFV